MKKLILFALAGMFFCITGCKKDEKNDLKELYNDLVSGSWKITSLKINDADSTSRYEQYRLSFSEENDPLSPQEIFNKVYLSEGSRTYNGTWIFTGASPDEEYQRYLSLVFVNNPEFQSLSARWGIESHSPGKVRLVKPVQDLSPDIRIMVLEKQ